jgi:hypothetical protein
LQVIVPGADVGARADRRVADVGQMIDLGALADLGLLELDEIADLGLVAEPRAGPDPGERADARLGADDRAFDMAEGVDRRAVGDLDPGPNTTCGSTVTSRPSLVS